MLRHWKPLLAIGACFFGIVGMLSGRPIERSPGVLAPEEPIQMAAETAPFDHGDYRVAPRARYDITARVLSVEPYRVDGGAGIAPIDFAVGWGPMSDSTVLDHFRVTQGSRFFTIYPDEEAIDLPTALRSAANMHLIPGSAQVREQLESTRAGNIVRLQGMLVNVSRADGFTWETSLSRNDTGAGACELFFVEQVEVR
ncbi:hypothetical protein HNQ60_003434 [Povalibacter uvarum]|uniref:Uncharacterized protein n=1 Tax=Povalibacter uvarum TaxID=732238 RepID=A0A841HN37_9GAMM|nr:hypothetical protein [Povalibacter uvarum]MBB6094547.1 hypothetical protein [Povalibacter uvarum]